LSLLHSTDSLDGGSVYRKAFPYTAVRGRIFEAISVLYSFKVTAPFSVNS